MKNLLTTIIVLSICNASDAIAEDWPVNPTTTQHSVVGTIGEFRGSASNQRFHKGVDITDDERGVYAITAGTTASGGSVFANRYVSAGGVSYYHTDPDLPDGTAVNIGDRIGTMRTDGNVHVHIARAGVNYLNGLLDPFVDNTNPTLHEHFFKREGQNYTTNRPDLNENDLWGKIDVVMRASDTRLDDTGNDPGVGGVAPYSIKYELRSSDNTSVVETVDYLVFSHAPPNNAAASHIFGVGTTTSDFYYVVTNNPFATPYNRYWNSFGRSGVTENWSGAANLDAREIQDARYKDARYTVRMILTDVQHSGAAHTVQEDHVVVLNNFKPYVKRIDISGTDPKYVGKWVFNKTDGSFKFIKTTDGFLSPGTYTVTLEFSEAVRDTPTLSIATFASAITLASAQPEFEKTIWTGTLTILASDHSHDGEQILTISANDLSGAAGEPLDGDPSTIALRDASGVFQDPDNRGNTDTLHKIKIDTQAPVSSLDVKTTP